MFGFYCYKWVWDKNLICNIWDSAMCIRSQPQTLNQECGNLSPSLWSAHCTRHPWHWKCMHVAVSRHNFELNVNTYFFLCFLCVFEGCVSCNLLCITDEGCCIVAETFGSLYTIAVGVSEKHWITWSEIVAVSWACLTTTRIWYRWGHIQGQFEVLRVTVDLPQSWA